MDHRAAAIAAAATAVAAAAAVYMWTQSSTSDMRRRAAIKAKIARTRVTLRELEEYLQIIEAEANPDYVSGEVGSNNGAAQKKKKQIRIWMDGAFDVMHYGHMNAFRQGRLVGTWLVVGVNTDRSIEAAKGAPPVLNDEERTICVSNCKWVDAVEPNCPYVMNEEYLNRMIDKWNLDFIVHGDDPCIVDGVDVYQTAVDKGMYRTIPRTEGVSTTEIVGRMLLMTKDHHESRTRLKPITDGAPGSPVLRSVSHREQTQSFDGVEDLSLDVVSDASAAPGSPARDRSRSPSPSPPMSPTHKCLARNDSYIGRETMFLTTNHMLQLFGRGVKPPAPGQKVVYIGGAFDLFHAGHVEALKLARQYGDYVLVGVHNDAIVNVRKGGNHPIMNLNERVLSVLGCKLVDDVVIDAPFVVTDQMMAALNISIVVHETTLDEVRDDGKTVLPDVVRKLGGEVGISEAEHMAYTVPRKQGKYVTIQSPLANSISTQRIIDRIKLHEKRIQQKVAKKKAAESEYYQDRYSDYNKDGKEEKKK